MEYDHQNKEFKHPKFGSIAISEVNRLEIRYPIVTDLDRHANLMIHFITTSNSSKEQDAAAASLVSCWLCDGKKWTMKRFEPLFFKTQLIVLADFLLIKGTSNFTTKILLMLDILSLPSVITTMMERIVANQVKSRVDAMIPSPNDETTNKMKNFLLRVPSLSTFVEDVTESPILSVMRMRLGTLACAMMLRWQRLADMLFGYYKLNPDVFCDENLKCKSIPRNATHIMSPDEIQFWPSIRKSTVCGSYTCCEGCRLAIFLQKSYSKYLMTLTLFDLLLSQIE